MNRLAQLANTATEMHSLQDGATIGAILALSLHYPPAVSLLALVLVGDGVASGKLLKRADTFVRTEEIRTAPEYFITGFLTSTAGVSAFVVGIQALGLLG